MLYREKKQEFLDLREHIQETEKVDQSPFPPHTPVHSAGSSLKTFSLAKVKILVPEGYSLEQRSPTFLAPGTGFMEDNFSTDRGGEEAMVQVVMRAMGSDGEQQRKLRSLTRRPPPAVRPSSKQATDQY